MEKEIERSEDLHMGELGLIHKLLRRTRSDCPS